MGPIGSKVAYEYVSRDDPKQTIDSHCSISIFTPVMNRVGEKKKKLVTWGVGRGPRMTYMLTYDTVRLGLMGLRDTGTSVSDNL